MMMNNWAVVAASELPLADTIAEMHAVGERYSPGGGIVFAAFGGLLALAWAVVTLHPRIPMPHWVALTIWASVLAMGAPAYFFMSFGNLNSVGDTFSGWNASAAFALEVPFYVVSGIAVLLAGGTIITAIVGRVIRRESTRTLPSNGHEAL